MDNWSKLPDEIVDQFRDRLSCIEDLVRFGCVCKLWQKSYVTWKKKHVPCGPWLMLTTLNKYQGLQTFFNFSSKRRFGLQLPSTQIQGRRCWGSRFGWLVTIGVDLHIHLLNPLSLVQISLPSQPTFPDQYNRKFKPEKLRRMFVEKFILSSNPSHNLSCVVLAIYSEFRKLAFAKPGDKTWISFDQSDGCKDAIFFQDQLYLINSEATLMICQINNTSYPKATQFASPPDDIDLANKFYLIEMSGDLLLVERVLNAEDNPLPGKFHYMTEAFQAYKFNFQTRIWTELYDLGDHCLFVGNNASFAITSSVYPEFKSNCIYFTDDHFEVFRNRYCDMGVFDFEGESVRRIYSGDHMFSTFSRPLFMMPSM